MLNLKLFKRLFVLIAILGTLVATHSLKNLTAADSLLKKKYFLYHDVFGRDVLTTNKGIVRMTGYADLVIPTINDFADKSQRARLTQGVIVIGDVWESSPTVINTVSTQTVSNLKLSSTTLTFGDVCMYIIGNSSSCKTYNTGLTITLKQIIQQPGMLPITRILSVQGILTFDGCTNKGRLVFTIPGYGQVKPSIKYDIALRGVINGAPLGNNPCVSASPVPTATPTSNIDPRAL